MFIGCSFGCSFYFSLDVPRIFVGASSFVGFSADVRVMFVGFSSFVGFSIDVRGMLAGFSIDVRSIFGGR